MNQLELYEAILHTPKDAEQLRSEYDDVTDEEIKAYEKIFRTMNGQKALIAYVFQRYEFMALQDPIKNKEVCYLMEQDPMFGCYVDQREEFDRDYDNGDYAPDASFVLKKEWVEIVKRIGGQS